MGQDSMSDLIDERNKREKMKNSIVKFWNVNYVDTETLKMQQAEEEAARAKALEEAEKAAELNRAYEEASYRREDYNVATGSYSGHYGQGAVDEVTKGQIDKILQEKDAILRSLIEGEE